MYVELDKVGGFENIFSSNMKKERERKFIFESELSFVACVIHSSAIIFRTQREEGFRAGIFLNLITTPDTKSWICIVGSLYSNCTERSSGHTCYTRDSASAHYVTLVLWDISKTIRVSPLTCLNSVRCSDAVPPLSPPSQL